MAQKSSLCYWYPLIAGKIPTPKTEIVPVHADDIDALFGVLDGKQMFPPSLKKNLIETATRFSYPLFMRTDHTSGKHDFKSTCYVTCEQELISHAINLFEDALMKDLNTTAYVLREFLELDSGFTAFRGLPISRERRYFVEGGEVLCHHPYWPEDAIEFWEIKRPDNFACFASYQDERQFRKNTIRRRKAETLPILKDLNTETPEEVSHLTELAEIFSRNVPGAWSVDFAMTRAGQWLMIDAAEAFRSWHPSDCPVAFGEGA